MTYKAATWCLARLIIMACDLPRWVAAKLRASGNRGLTKCRQCKQSVHRSNTDLQGVCIDCWE